MNLLLFFVCAAVVVFFAIKLSNNADWFEKNTKISGAIVGFILAATTSLPELISGITSVLIKQEELAISSILGSNLFNYNIVVVANLAFISYMAFNKLGKNINKIMYFIISIYIVIITSFTLLQFASLGFDFRLSLTTVLILIIYVLSIKSLDDSDDVVEDTFATKTAVKKKFFSSFCFAVVLIVSSSLLAKVVELVMYDLNLSASLAGSILLGASTSLPEFVSAIVLMRMRQYNVAISSVLSSNLFNFFVLFILDILTAKSIMLYFNMDTMILVAFGMVNTIILTVTFKFYKHTNKYIYMIPSILILGIYFIYLNII
ncbi:MAG: sodium:calcium antiporter [Bacilli bacterium]